MKTVKTKTIVVLAVSLAFVFAAQNVVFAATAGLQYKLLESLPGFYSAGSTMTDLPALILAIYKFGIWTVGIAGLFMLVIGGFYYMASAGNTATASSAKGIIWDSIIGIIAALAAYLIMYVINPDLTKINIAFTPVGIEGYGGATGTGNPTPLSAGCQSDQMLGVIKSAAQGNMDPCLVFAMLNTESACTASAQSSAGACGIAQIMPATAGMSCADLISNPTLSITKGVGLLSSALNSGKLRGSISGSGNSLGQAVMDLYASYNGGMGALDPSVSCDFSMRNNFGFAYVKWDCPINPGGYTETVTATARYLNSYNACKTDATIQSKLN